MTLPKWDEEMKFELLRLKSELRSDNFRVLYNPIGLGRLTNDNTETNNRFLGTELFPVPKLSHPISIPPQAKAVVQEVIIKREGGNVRSNPKPIPLPHTSTLTLRDENPPQNQTQPQPQPQHQPASSSINPLAAVPPLPFIPQGDVPLSKRLLKKFLVHSLDITFVVMTLGLGLLLATWLIGPGNVSENPDLLKHAAPLRFLMESSTLALVLGVYGFFSFYWLFFKLVSGSTLGESFLDNFWSLQNPRNSPSVNDFGDS